MVKRRERRAPMIEIEIQSNISQVREEFELFVKGLAVQLAGVTEPKSWRDAARAKASEVLLKLAKTEEERALALKYAKQVTVGYWGAGGMEWTLIEPDQGELNILEAIKLEKSGPLIGWANRDKAQRVADLILEWVEQEKRKDERDAGKSDPQIRNRLMQIIFGPFTPERESARDALLPHLQEFADAQGEGLSEERRVEWLTAVLEGWVELVMELAPTRIRKAIAAAWSGVLSLE
jgi:hypothetical protein